jgi:peptide/nickel transport system substrate-binding protein
MVQGSQPVGLSRREMLRAVSVATMGLVGGLLAACSSPAPPAPAAPTAAPAAPAAANPTAAPAAANPTQAVAVAAKPTVATAAAAPKPGRQLIGQLEGPSVVVDTAQIPKTFNEAPALADLVKQGKLPPVAQRLPEEPLVLAAGLHWPGRPVERQPHGDWPRQSAVLGLHR